MEYRSTVLRSEETRLAELVRVCNSLEQYQNNDVENMFLLIKDLLRIPDAKTQAVVQKFLQLMVRHHPLLIESQGNRIFKYLKSLKDCDVAVKLKLIRAITDQKLQYVTPSKGLFALIYDLIIQCTSTKLIDVLAFINDLVEAKPKGTAVELVEVLLALLINTIQLIFKRHKKGVKKDARDPFSEQVQSLLSLCNTCLANNHYNACVIEHIIVIFCFIVRTRPEDTTKCFRKILATEYRCYAISFLLDLLEGVQLVSIKARIVDKGPKKESLLEFSHKILTASMSTFSKELAKSVWNHEDFATAEELTDTKVRSLQEYSRDKLLSGAVYLIGVVALSREETLLTLMSVMKAYSVVTGQKLSQASLQVMRTLEEIINTQGEELDEEWDFIFEIAGGFMEDKLLKTSPDAVSAVQRLFVALRNLYIADGFRGMQNQLMQLYDKAKYVINDTYFDAIFMRSLKDYQVEFMIEKVAELLAFTPLIRLKELDGGSPAYDYRMCELLNCFEAFYKEEVNETSVQLLEDLFINKAKEYQAQKLSLECRLKVLKILQTIALRTTENTRFNSILQLLVIAVTGSPQTGMLKVVSSLKQKLETPSSTEHEVAKEAHQCLFVLFRENYLQYPPVRLLKVIKAFLETLRTRYKDIMMLTLRFLSFLTYDREFHLVLTSWKVPTYFSGMEWEEYDFSTQMIIDSVVPFLNLDLGSGLVLRSLEVIATVCKSHYGLYNLDLSKLVKALAEFLDSAITRKELDAALKTAEILQLILAQKDPLSVTEKKAGIKLEFADIISIFEAYLCQLNKIIGLFRPDLEEFRKSKNWKDFQGPPAKTYAEIPFFAKPLVKKLAHLAKSLMSAIGATFYVYKEELLFAMNELLTVLRSYIKDHLLAEKFSTSVLDVFSNLYYSDLVQRLTVENILGVIEITMQIGWRNIFCLSDHSIPPLLEFILHKFSYTVRALFGRTSPSAELTSHEKNAANFFSILTYPSGEAGRKIVEDLDTRYKYSKGKPKELSWTHFGYQKDANLAMHLATENVIHFFGSLRPELQSDIVPYLSRIAALEAKNESSGIIQQTIVLNELVHWASSTNIGRFSAVEEASSSLEEGKTWLLNDGILHVITERNMAKITLRNATSKVAAKVEINNVKDKTYKKPEDNFSELSKIHKTEDVEIQPIKENEYNMSPEYLLGLLPGSLQSRFGEKLGAWEPVNVAEEIKGLVKTLDQIWVHNVHSVGVLYIPKNCIDLA